MIFSESHNRIDKTTPLCASGGRVFLSVFCADETDICPFWPLHRHDELEVVLVSSGSVTVWRDGTKYTANEGDVCVFPPFSMHTFGILSGQSVTLKGVSFNFRLAAGNPSFVGFDRYAAYFNGSSVRCVIGADEPTGKALGEQVLRLFADDVSEADLVDATDKAISLLQGCVSAEVADVTWQKREHAAKTALDYVVATLPARIEVSDVASHCGYSEFYLMKLFKAYTGVSVVDYANKLRLFGAAKMLATDNKSVREVANDVGFDNVSYFNRQFLRLYGVTPTDFRNQKKNVGGK